MRKILAITTISAILIGLMGPIGLIRPVRPTQAVGGSGPNLTVNYLSGVTTWGDNTSAGIGDAVQFYVEIHNTNVPSNAENLTVRVNLPSTPTSTVTSTAYASTTSPTTVPGSQTNVSDSTNIINLPANALLQYRSGSLRVTADLDGDGVKDYDGYAWPNDSIATAGINLGTLAGGAPAVIQMDFYADVVAAQDPNVTVKFLSANPERPADGWSDNTQANPGDELQYYIEIHNTNVPSVAKDLKVKVNFPTGEGTTFSPTAYASYTSNPSSVSDSTKVTFSSKADLSYRSGSMRITWDKNGDGVKEYDGYAWPNNDIVGGGIVLGDLWGCNPFVIQISFWADSKKPKAPKEPKVTIEKKVFWNGQDYDSIDRNVHLFDPGETVEYRLTVKNEGEQEASDVKVVDHLPSYIRTFENTDKKEFDVGALAGGESWSTLYSTRVAENLPQNDRTQENRATVTSSNAGSDEDTAFVWINGPEILAAEVQAAAVAAPVELPVTGPAVPVALALAGALPLGVLLRRSAARKFLK